VDTILGLVMTASEAARELRESLKAPLWALSVAAVRENGTDILVIRVDPTYRHPLDYPNRFRGFDVTMTWRTPIRARG
jgi:hypothetical protein